MPNNGQWVDVPAAQTTGDDGWTDVPASTPKPRKQGFKRSLRSGFGLRPEGTLSDDISQIGEGFRQMYHHPFTSANDLVEGLYQGQQDVADKGVARMKGPRLMDKVEGGAQYLESGVPGVGPILSRMGEQTEAGDWGGAAGTGLPLAAAMDTAPARGMAGDMLRTPGGTVKPLPRLATQLAAGAAGHEMMPYAGGYLGYKAGGPLADMIVPAETPETFPGARATPWEAPVEEAPPAAAHPSRLATAMDADPVTRIPVPRREFPGENPSNMASVPRGELEGLARTGKPGAGTQIQQLGGKVLYTPEERVNAPRSSTTFSSKGGAPGTPPASEARPIPPRAKSSGTRATPQASSPGSERRVNPGLRDATGPDPVRQSLVREAQRVIDDPKATVRDKRIARDQMADIKAHPFESAKGQDFVKEARAGKPKMTREQAEAADAKRRSPGRKKRLSEEIGND